MRNYSIETNGYDIRIHITPGIHSISHYSYAFNDSADIVSETDSRRAIDDCDTCIIASELVALNLGITEPYGILDSLGCECYCGR